MEQTTQATPTMPNPQPSPKPEGCSVLRVTSIILVVYAAVALISALFIMMGVYFAAADDVVGLAAGVAAVVGIVAFVGGLLNLFVGLVGLRASKRSQKNTLAFALGIVSVIFGVYSLVTAIGAGDPGSIANAVVGMILPTLYLYGVVQTRKGVA